VQSVSPYSSQRTTTYTVVGDLDALEQDPVVVDEAEAVHVIGDVAVGRVAETLGTDRRID